MKIKKILLLLERDYPTVFKLLGARSIFYLFRKILIFMKFTKVLMIAPFAYLYAVFNRANKPFIMIAIRDAHIGPCSLQLIDMVDKFGSCDLVLSVKNIKRYRSINTDLLHEANLSISHVVEQDSFAALCYVYRARVHIAFESVFETFIAAMRPQVWLGRTKKPVLVPDGIVTKTNGNLIPSNKVEKADLRDRMIGIAARWITYVSQSGVDNYRSCLNGGVRSPSLMRTVGLPRFLRAKNLVIGNIQPVFTPNFREMLANDSSSHRVMLALTKNKNSSDLDYFLEQMRCNFNELQMMLEDTDTSLWIKAHQSTLPIGIVQDKNGTHNQKRIFEIGAADGLSSVDLFNVFDGLLTDISSIYVDFLPFDKPIGFIQFQSWKQRNRFCYPESPFYPGVKLETHQALMQFFSDIVRSNDAFAQDREYARRVLLGEIADEAFWNELLQD